MKKKNIAYKLINVFVLSLTTIIFVCNYVNINKLFHAQTLFSIIILVGTVLLVHAIKACRLYVALYGVNISLKTYLKTYCKVTPVSIILPYKLGELFRIYCYGYEMNDFLRSVVTIMLDRFMDTAALLTMFFALSFFHKSSITYLFILLLLFLVFLLLLFFIFPGIYAFWKKYFLLAKATENKIWGLKTLEILNTLYKEIEKVIKGRGIIMYFLSLIAWGIEIGNIIIVSKLIVAQGVTASIAQYLNSAMNEKSSAELSQFIFVSLMVLILFYTVLQTIRLIKGKRIIYEYNSNL